MNANDLSIELYSDLEFPEDLDVTIIADWLINNVGSLNALLNLHVMIDQAGNMTFFDADGKPAVDSNKNPITELNTLQKVIFKELYIIKHFTRWITKNLGAAAYDWSEIVEGDSNIRRVSKNEIAKTYLQLRKAAREELEDLIFFYKQNLSTPAAYGVRGNLFRYLGYFGGIYGY